MSSISVTRRSVSVSLLGSTSKATKDKFVWIYWWQTEPDQLACFLRWNQWMCEEDESAGCNLPRHQWGFDVISHNIIIWKLRGCGLKRQTVREAENWQVMPGRSPATREAPKGSVLRSTLFSIFISNLDDDTVRFVDDLNCLDWQTAKLQCRGSFINLRSGPTDTAWGSARKHDPLQAGKHLAEGSSWRKGAGDYRGQKAKCESPASSHLNRACHILGYTRKAVARKLREVIISLSSALHPTFGSSSPRGTWRNWKGSSGGFLRHLEGCERSWGSCACLVWSSGG